VENGKGKTEKEFIFLVNRFLKQNKYWKERGKGIC
jgi:hypothetical protein